MSYKSLFLSFTAIMSNRQTYHCYMYSEQATENMPAESEPLLPLEILVNSPWPTVFYPADAQPMWLQNLF